MAASRFNFKRMPDPLEQDRFLQEHWKNSRFFLQRNDADYYADLLSMADFDHIISSTNLRYPAFRLVKKDSHSLPHEHTKDIPRENNTLNGVADVEKVIAEYQNGGTIVLEALQQSWTPLAMLCQNLETFLNHPAQANASWRQKMHKDSLHATTPVTSSFSRLRAQSNGGFTIRPSNYLSKRQQYHPAVERLGSPLYQFDVTAVDVIYVPRGYIHEAATAESTSVHITVGIGSCTWVRVFAGGAQIDLR